MSEFTPIETQEDFDKAIKSRLAQKDRELAEKYKDYLSPDKAEAMKADYEKQLSEAKQTVKDAQEKLKTFDDTVSELKTRAEKAETSLLKNKVAIENKLPIKLADRLIGSTEEELKADAEALLEGLNLRSPSTPPLHIGGTNKPSNTYEAGIAELATQMSAQFVGN